MTIIWLHLSIKIEDRLLTSGTTGRSDCLPTLLIYYKIVYHSMGNIIVCHITLLIYWRSLIWELVIRVFGEVVLVVTKRTILHWNNWITTNTGWSCAMSDDLFTKTERDFPAKVIVVYVACLDTKAIPIIARCSTVIVDGTFHILCSWIVRFYHQIITACMLDWFSLQIVVYNCAWCSW